MKSKRIPLEMVLVIVVSLSGMWFWPDAKTFFALIPVVYLLVERRIRHRPWRDLGFSGRSIWPDLKANWILFVFLAFIIQPVIVVWAKSSFPEYLAHIQGRLPFDAGVNWGLLLPLLAFSLLGEEMTYRALIQGRLAPFLGVPAAIGTSSLLFGLAHIAPGPLLVVLTDVGLIVVSSILYGLMLARRNNLWPVWLAHFSGDVLGLLALTFS
jgi:membrane protease YdiL (CAAX protease family)